MKPLHLTGIVLTTLALIVGAGYLGYQRVQPNDSPLPQKPITVAVTRGDVQQTVTAPGQLENTQEALASFTVGGTIDAIAVRPGSTVDTGDLLIHLNTDDLTEALAEAQQTLETANREHQQQLAQAELNLLTAQAQLAKHYANPPSDAAVQADLLAAQTRLQDLSNGPDENELAIASADLQQTEITLRNAQLAYNQIAYGDDVGTSFQAQQLQEATLAHQKALARYNLAVKDASSADLAAARADLTQAQAAVERAEAEEMTFAHEATILEAAVNQVQLTLANLQAGPDPALAQAVEKARTNLVAAKLTAPFAGTVIDVSVKVGQRVSPGEPVLVLVDPQATEVRTTVIEEDLPLVKPGQSTETYFDAEPIEPVIGTVARVVPRRETGRDRPLYPVYITPQIIPQTLVSGMTADTSIIIEARTQVLRLPRTLVRAGSDNSAQVKVWHQGQVETREITIGLRGDVYVEIVAGLQEGDEVVSE